MEKVTYDKIVETFMIVPPAELVDKNITCA